MESKYELQAKSLVVPSVIEVAKDPLGSVPDIYLHHDLEPPFVSDNTHKDQLLPVISMALLLEDDPTEFAKLHDACSNLGFFQLLSVISMPLLLEDDLTEFTKLYDACSNWGFIQVVSHGVSVEMIERFKVESMKFFELPMEEKRKYWQTQEEIEGFGQKFVKSKNQKLGWYDAFSLTILPLKLRRPHLLPLLPLPFRETLESYTNELKQLATKIFDCMAKDLKIAKDEFRGLFDDGRQSFRILYYPPCPQYDKVIGSMPHSDAGALTILLQLNEVDGLQIKKDGTWLPVSPLPNAFVVNIGDIMEIVSNGMYSSVEHRVMVNPEKERLSAASFFHARLEAEIGPSLGLVTSESPARFRRITTSEYLTGFYAQPLQGKSYLDTMRIE